MANHDSNLYINWKDMKTGKNENGLYFYLTSKRIGLAITLSFSHFGLGCAFYNQMIHGYKAPKLIINVLFLTANITYHGDDLVEDSELYNSK